MSLLVIYTGSKTSVFTSFTFTFIPAADTAQAETEEGDSFVHPDFLILLNLGKLANKDKESYGIKKCDSKENRDLKRK